MKRTDIVFDYSKLIGKIAEVYGNRSKFSTNAGIPYSRVTSLLSGKTAFSQSDIILWSESLQITNEELTDYFFKQKVC